MFEHMHALPRLLPARILRWQGAATVAAALLASPLAADQGKAASTSPPMFERIAPLRSPTAEIPLYATPLPRDAMAALPEVWDRMEGTQAVVRNVTIPTLTPFLPATDQATGAAVVVLPGGGFTLLAMDTEG